jgi:hypothetical protein
MTFLNPFLLFGLAAAAIPILIHLLNLRKLRTIDFSTLQFLKELQKTKMRRVKIRQWLLLLLRTLLVIALVLAFSRPALKGSFAGTLGSRARTTMVILLDDSPSMAIRTNRGVVFQQAKRAALELLPLFKDGDAAYVLRLSDVRHRPHDIPLTTAESLREIIEKSTVSQVTVPYSEALNAAAGILAGSKNLNHELYIVTDLQATQFTLAAVKTDTMRVFPPETRIFVLNAGEEQNNEGVTSARVVSRILSSGKPMQVETEVQNFSRNPARGLVLSIYLDGTRQVQQLIDIEPFSSRTLRVTAIPRSSGDLHGYAQIDDDILDVDNRRYFVAHIPRRIPVLLAGDIAADARLPLLALRAAVDTSGTGLFDLHTLPPAQLSTVDIRQFDVVILCGPQRFSPSTADLLGRFVRSGGGLILFPALQPDLTSYNADLFPALGIPPAAPGSVVDSQSVSAQTFGKIDFAHPLFGGLFEPQTSGTSGEPRIESPKIHTSIVPRTGQSGQTIIALTGGDGFLTEYRTGSGRVLLFSVEAGLRGSDFPVKGIFVPLLHRSVLYLAAEADSSQTYEAGDDARIGIRTAGNETYVLRAPSGLEERIVPRIAPSSGTAFFDCTNLAETGIYELRRSRTGESKSGGEILKAFAVNIAPSESDLRQASEARLDEFWATLGIDQKMINTVASGGKVDTRVLESRFGVELWKYFLILAIACAIGEMIVGREPGKTSASSTSA